MDGFLVILIIFGAIWLLAVMPVRRKRAQHAAMQDSVDVGDEVISAGGIHGTVKAIEDDRLRLEIAPEVVVTLDRRAVAAVAREVEIEAEPQEDPETPAEAG